MEQKLNKPAGSWVVSNEPFGLYMAGYVCARVCAGVSLCVCGIIIYYEDTQQEAYYNTLPFRMAVNIKGTLIFFL